MDKLVARSSCRSAAWSILKEKVDAVQVARTCPCCNLQVRDTSESRKFACRRRSVHTYTAQMYAFVARQHSHGENWPNGMLMIDQQVAPECGGTDTYAQNFGTSDKDAMSTPKKSKISYV